MKRGEVMGSAMYWAGLFGRADMILKLVCDEGVDVDVKNPAFDGADMSKECKGWTALHSAARNGHVGAVRELLKLGADVNSVPGGEGSRFCRGWNAFCRAANGLHGEARM